MLWYNVDWKPEYFQVLGLYGLCFGYVDNLVHLQHPLRITKTSEKDSTSNSSSMKWMKSSRELTFLSTSRKLKSKRECSIIMAYGSWQNFRNSYTFLALYRVTYCSLFLKSSFSLGRISFHFLYDGILLFFFVVHQIHRAKRPTSKLFFYTYISPFETRKINRRFSFLHETQ